MNIVMWVLAGGALGWVAYQYWGFNEDRGLPISIAIGGAGGFLGGKILAPLFATAEAIPGDFSPTTMFFAAGAAAICIFLGNFVSKRWGV